MVTKGMKPSIKIIKTGPRASFLFASFLLLAGLLGCTEKRDQLVFSGLVMGTTYQVKIVPNDLVVSNSLADQIDERLQSLDGTLTTYQKTSELMTFNQSTINKPLVVSKDLFEVMSIAKQIYEQTNGAFDPTVGPLVNLWGFGPNYTDQVIPPPESIAEHLSAVGLNHLLLDKQAGTVTRLSNIHLDLSAVAKGYAVDEVAELLASHGIESYLVEVGGELRLKGLKANGERWRIAIEKPYSGQGAEQEDAVQEVLALENVAVATSGDYRNYFEQEGKRYSHTIDPRTGYPIDHNLASVTVIAQTAARADALATAMMVLGPEGALKLAEQNDLAVYLLVKRAGGFESKTTTLFSQYLLGE
jgi:thiamine biosynthesis lipoprotein